MKGLYKFYEDFGRMGDMSGIFVADSKDVEKAIGKTVVYDEPLGKHSEILITVRTEILELITTDRKAIEVVEEYGLEQGYDIVWDALNLDE